MSRARVVDLVLWLGLPLPLVLFGFYECRKIYRLDREGVTVSGIVVDKYSSDDLHFLVVRYGLHGTPDIAVEREPEGKARARGEGDGVFQGRFQVSSSVFDRSTAGSSVDVRCLTSDPECAEVDLHRLLPALSLCAGIGWIAAGGIRGLSRTLKSPRRRGRRA